MTTTTEEYLVRLGVQADKQFSIQEAEHLVNRHVIALYRGRIRLTDGDTFTGLELAEKLHVIHDSFEKSFQNTWDEDDLEDD